MKRILRLRHENPALFAWEIRELLRKELNQNENVNTENGELNSNQLPSTSGYAIQSSYSNITSNSANQSSSGTFRSNPIQATFSSQTSSPIETSFGLINAASSTIVQSLYQSTSCWNTVISAASAAVTSNNHNQQSTSGELPTKSNMQFIIN